MKLLDRYVGRAVVAATAVVMLVLVGIDTLFTVIDELDDLGKGDYGGWQLAQYVVLTVPGSAYELFPSSVLLGALIGLGALGSANELVVIRAAGVSVARVLWGVLKAGLLMTLVAAAVGELVAPPAEQYAERQKSLAQTQRILTETRHGFWMRNDLEFINVRQVLPGPILRDITIYRLDHDYALKRVTAAEQARFSGPGWSLSGVRYSVLEEDGVRTGAHDRQERTALIDPELLDVVVLKPERLSAWGLYRYAAYMRANQLDAGQYELAFWMRLMTPLSSLVMILLAAPFVFGPLRTAGIGQRLVTGVFVGLAFYIVNQALNHLGLVYGVPPLFSAALPPLLFLVLAVAALRRFT